MINYDIIKLIVEERYDEAISDICVELNDEVDEHTCAFDTDEDVEERINNGEYGITLQNRRQSLFRWLCYALDKNQLEIEERIRIKKEMFGI